MQNLLPPLNCVDSPTIFHSNSIFGDESVKLPIGISVVVPVFNNAVTLFPLVDRLKRVLEVTNEPYELILVNDNGPDACWETVKKMTTQYSWVRGICMMRNYGQHNAVLCGIRAAAYNKLVTMDDDLQHMPEQIPVLLALLNKKNDVVYGTPLQEKQNLARAIAKRITKLVLSNIVGIKVAKDVGPFRAFYTQLRDAFSWYQTSFVSIDVLLTWATTRFSSVAIPFDKRYAGTSHYSFPKLVRHALNMMTGFSTFPLQFASLVGFTFALFGVGVLVYVLGKYFLLGIPIEGFPFLASIIAIFSGAQLFALGVIGEYIARIHFRSMQQPAYVTRQIINFDTQ